MNSISKYQLAAMLLITDIFSLFCTGGSISLVTLGGMLSAAGVQFLMTLSFTQYGGIDTKGQKALLLVYLLFFGGTLFSSLWRTGSVIYIPYEKSLGLWGRLLTAGLIALVCLYSSSTGIRAVSRAAVIAAAAGLLCIVIDFGSAVLNADWGNISRPEAHSYIYEFMRGFALSGGLGSFYVLTGKVRGNRSSAAAVYFGAKAALTAAVLLTALSVAGGIAGITDFPVITAAQLSQPFEAQRIDSVFLVIFVSFAVFAVTVQVMTASYLLKELFPGFRRWRSSTVTALIIGAALLISGRELILMRAAALAALMLLTVLSTIKNPLPEQADR